MGQTLSTPATEKHTESGSNERFYYSVSEMQGWRITMEDAHATVLSLDEESGDNNSFFAVYDGHGGGTVAKFAGQNVHRRLITEESYREKRYDEALKRAFLGTDEDLLANPAHAKDPSGCTAVASLITDKEIYVANAGDSRAVICTKGKVDPLSFDHKPTNDTEKARITAAGGYIEYGRVNGNLALSRALGDFDFKKNYSVTPERQIITADPDITRHEITEEDEFVVLACDGIWDCLTSQQVVDFVRLQVSEGKDLSEICENICEHCLAPDTSSGAGIGCDNMTIMVAAVLHGRTKEEWATWITDRVKTEYGYKTPTSLPQIYSQSRLAAFTVRRNQWESRGANSRNDDTADNLATGFLTNAGLGSFARVLGTTGGLSFHPGGQILSDTGHLMFGNDDSDDDDSGDEDMNGRMLYSNPLSTNSSDPTSLKGQLDAFEHDDEMDGTRTVDSADSTGTVETDGAILPLSKSPPPDVASDTHSDASAPAAESHTLPNGDATRPTQSVEQLKSAPGGDEASPAVQLEGLMDTSEDPLKM